MAGGAGRLGPGRLGAFRPDHRRQRDLLVHRHPRHGLDPGAADGRRGSGPLRDRGGWARYCSGREWSAPPGGSSSVWRCCGAGRWSGSSRPHWRSAPSPCWRSPGWRSSPATRCSPRRSSRCSLPPALLGWRLLERGRRWRAAWQAFAVLVAADVPRLGAEPIRPAHTVHTDLANQGQIERDLGDLAKLRCLRAALPADLRAEPPRRSPPRLRPRRSPLADRQLQRAGPAAPRLLPRPGHVRSSSTTSSSTPTTPAASGRPSHRVSARCSQPLLEALSTLRIGSRPGDAEASAAHESGATGTAAGCGGGSAAGIRRAPALRLRRVQHLRRLALVMRPSTCSTPPASRTTRALRSG